MAEIITAYAVGEEWREAGRDGFSNETGGYPPGWAEAVSPEELVAAHAARLEVPDCPPGVVCLGREIVVEDFTPVVRLLTRELTEEELASLAAQRLAEVKAEAGRRILARYPTWRQANMNMRATELVDKRLDGDLTTEEEAERQDLLAASVWIKSIRSASDAIEAALPTDAAGLATFSAADAAGWPA